MKNKNTTPSVYKWEHAGMAAERLAIWAYAKFLNPESPQAEVYPLKNASSTLLQDGSWEFQLAKQNKTRKSKTAPEPIKESVKIQREMKAIGAQLRKDANFLKCYFSTSMIAEDLSDAIGRLYKLLVELAEKDPTAVKRLFWNSLVSVIELEKLSFREDSLRLIQAEASKQSMWPVPYSPHPRRKRELDKTMKKIGLADHNFQKLKGARWSNKSTAGKFAHRMGVTLWEIHFDGNLRQCLSMACVQPTAPRTKELVSQFGEGALKNLVVRTADANSPEFWEQRLVAQGWPRWIVKLHQLPELTQVSAPGWFEVGWVALREATSGNVASVPELARLGESSAAYARRQATTDIGKRGKQASRVESQIKKLLKQAFLKRFGNPS